MFFKMSFYMNIRFSSIGTLLTSDCRCCFCCYLVLFSILSLRYASLWNPYCLSINCYTSSYNFVYFSLDRNVFINILFTWVLYKIHFRKKKIILVTKHGNYKLQWTKCQYEAPKQGKNMKVKLKQKHRYRHTHTNCKTWWSIKNSWFK